MRTCDHIFTVTMLIAKAMWVASAAGLKRSYRNHGINRIQAGGVNLDENFVRLERWPGNVGERDLIESAVMFQDECFQVFVLVGVFPESGQVEFMMENSV